MKGLLDPRTRLKGKPITAKWTVHNWFVKRRHRHVYLRAHTRHRDRSIYLFRHLYSDTMENLLESNWRFLHPSANNGREGPVISPKGNLSRMRESWDGGNYLADNLTLLTRVRVTIPYCIWFDESGSHRENCGPNFLRRWENFRRAAFLSSIYFFFLLSPHVEDLIPIFIYSCCQSSRPRFVLGWAESYLIPTLYILRNLYTLLFFFRNLIFRLYDQSLYTAILSFASFQYGLCKLE